MSQANGNGRSVPINAPASAVVRNLAGFGPGAPLTEHCRERSASLDDLHSIGAATATAR